MPSYHVLYRALQLCYLTLIHVCNNSGPANRPEKGTPYCGGDFREAAALKSFMWPFSFVCRQESIRTAFLLSQGGEFAFVLLSLANELKVLPTDLNRLLIIVVVLSMALTPFLAEAGKRFAESTIEDDSEGVSLLHDIVHCWTMLK